MDTRRDGSPLLESAVEGHLTKQMKRIGGRAFKFMPSVKGNPDRIVVMPFGRIYFVELKRPKGGPSPAQRLWHARLFDMGHVVHIIDTRDMVDAFIAWAVRTGYGDMDPNQRRHDDWVAAQNHYEEKK